ncbi:MAG: ATP/GTP-binding protein [Candidatus Bathyarchaeia archaeon]|nr:ATP/GTP-binding protein [Candidatus Bathyarchaeota archaeon]
MDEISNPPSMFVVFLGTAGSGKTSLVSSFHDWLEGLGLMVGIANLDPGCRTTPYRSDFDVRDFFTVEKLMEDMGLGPNGAMVRAVELIEPILDGLSERFGAGDLWLVDTPGQSELFVFRRVGPKVIEALNRWAPAVSVYLVDPELAESPSGLVSSFSLALAARLRVPSPLLLVLSKGDIIGEDVMRMCSDMDYLRERILGEGVGSLTDLALGLLDLMRDLALAQRTVKVSARTREGLPELYDLIHESLCECGDLT